MGLWGNLLLCSHAYKSPNRYLPARHQCRRVRMAMTDLAAILAAAGYGDVQTVFATGNVVCRPAHTRDTAGYKADIKRLLSDRFGYRASLHIRTQADLIRLCAAADLFSETQRSIAMHSLPIVQLPSWRSAVTIAPSRQIPNSSSPRTGQMLCESSQRGRR